MEVCVDLEGVKGFVTSEAFTRFLVKNNTDISVSAYILQTLLNQIDIDMEKQNNGN